ncbi:uncharacterized protein [Rutidosis leptorrhynchoides]|uniref:uncharacterized protein n=1 Tax=Rutidosis leptorrhynchoides TaxID=125765 RepID=UPI003A9916D4
MSVDTATETDDAITGMFLINSSPARVLFDCGENRSFMSVTLCDKLKLPINVLSEPLRIEVGNGRTVPVTTFVSGVTIEIDRNEFPMTCLVMPIPNFDVVLGMDWLSRHKASIKCDKKIIHFPLADGTRAVARGEWGGFNCPLISMMKAKKSLEKGCDSFLAYVIDAKKEKKSVFDIPIVFEFPEVFLDELPGLPPVREVEYKIELLPGSTLVAKAPYQLAPSEIRDMMSQMQELLDRGFIRPNLIDRLKIAQLEALKEEHLKSEILVKRKVNLIDDSRGLKTFNRDLRFVSNFWQSLPENLGTRVNLSATYHPQTDGQSERTIQTTLTCWLETGEKQFVGPEIVKLTTEKVAIAREKLKAVRDRQKMYADPRRQPVIFTVGEQIVVLDLPAELAGIHNTINVSYLRKCKVDDVSQILPLQDLKVDMNKKLVEEPVRIVVKKITKLRHKQIPMVLVEWKHSLGSNLTWETEELMRTRYPRWFELDQISRTESPLRVVDL